MFVTLSRHNYLTNFGKTLEYNRLIIKMKCKLLFVNKIKLVGCKIRVERSQRSITKVLVF